MISAHCCFFVLKKAHGKGCFDFDTGIASHPVSVLVAFTFTEP